MEKKKPTAILSSSLQAPRAPKFAHSSQIGDCQHPLILLSISFLPFFPAAAEISPDLIVPGSLEMKGKSLSHARGSQELSNDPKTRKTTPAAADVLGMRWK